MGGSCKSLLCAPILLVLGIWLLVWNEGNSITQHKALNEGLRLVVDVGTESVDTSNEGQLVHFSGKATSSASISDPIFGVAPSNALKLKRHVEMYQWVESSHSSTKKNTGGSSTTTTTYTYDKTWKDMAISSSGFAERDGHQNPGDMQFSSATVVASPINVGVFDLPSEVTSKMDWYRPLASSLSTDTIVEESTQSGAKVFNNYFYLGSSSGPSNPQVGDTRVSFMEVPEQTISVVGKQDSDSLSTYTASSGGSFLLVEAGAHAAEEMFLHANQALTAQTWILRLVGLIIVWISFKSLVQPMQVVADCVPFIGDLLEAANDCVTFFLAACFSTMVIAVAWFAYRPLLSIFLLLLVGGATYAMRQRQKNKGVAEAVAYELPAMQQFKDNADDLA